MGTDSVWEQEFGGISRLDSLRKRSYSLANFGALNKPMKKTFLKKNNHQRL